MWARVKEISGSVFKGGALVSAPAAVIGYAYNKSKDREKKDQRAKEREERHREHEKRRREKCFMDDDVLILRDVGERALWKAKEVLSPLFLKKGMF